MSEPEPNPPPVPVKLPADLLAEIDRLAAQQDRSRASMVRRLLRLALAAKSETQAP